MLNNNTELYIGPLRFTYAVQKIQLQDRKSVQLLETARSNRNFIVDSGDSAYKGQIRLLFTGLDEINRGIGDDQQDSGLRALIALFRCSPIVSIKNDTIGASWKKADQLYEEDYVSIESKSKFFTDIVPIAIDQISLENVPDVPYSIQVTLSISRIEVAPVSQDETLQYCGEKSLEDPLEHPRDAFWLTKWITQILKKDTIPELTPSDFQKIEFTWYGKDSIGQDIFSRSKFAEWITVHLDTASGHPGSGGLHESQTAANVIGISENCSLRHKFAYNTLQGDNFPFAVHMGSTSRILSMDLVFNNQKSDKDYKRFCRFKESSDEIIKSKRRFDRVTGWNVFSPLSKLLSTSRTVGIGPLAVLSNGIFVPISVNSETSDTPNMINTRIDMLESNVDFYSHNEVELVEGGTDYDDLKEYFDKVLKEELIFRRKLVTDREKALKELVGEGDNPNYKSYGLYWPIEKGLLNIKGDSSFGILNIDTLRAVFLSSALDNNSNLLNALQGSPHATGKVIANHKPGMSDKVGMAFSFLWKAIAGLKIDGDEFGKIQQAVREIVSDHFLVYSDDFNRTLHGFWEADVLHGELTEFGERMLASQTDKIESTIDTLTKAITIGLLGDSHGFSTGGGSVTGKLISDLAKTTFAFSEQFKETLFKIIIERKRKPENLPHVYSTDGIYTAFYKLITSFTLERDATMTTEEARQELLNKRNRNSNLQSLYPDLLLPTYEELYGKKRWKEFAPSIEDLGIDTYNDTSMDRPRVLAVQADDIVSPAAWFYIRRVKSGPQGLRSLAKNAAEAINEMSPRMSISMPFNIEDINEIKEKIRGNQEKYGPDTGTSGTRTDRTVADIIKDALIEYREIDPKSYRRDLTNILSHSERFEKKFLGEEEGSIKVYLHHNGNRILRKLLNIPGLGAEIYRVIKDNKELQIGKNLPQLHMDAQYTTVFDDDVKYHRHLDENSRKILDSSLDQIADDHYSPERLFPAVKVYLVDRRGNDIIADDALFNVNAIVSIDITKDKDDADLAVIKIADPLFTLQSDYFTQKNVTDGKDRRILNTLKDSGGVLKRYKLIQGRPIQIRMGYSSMAYNIPIVFTGRITEIVPGDQLTIVAQGWKAELINRKVNFYNDDPKNWGARDLAVQAITYAGPEGIGDYFPEFDAQYILRNMDAQNIRDSMQQTISNGQNVDLEGIGSRGIGQGISNWARRFIGMRSNNKENLGFDTRLKNIWYPDTALYNNVFGVSTKAGLMPSWQNDSWIVPLQSSWDVLKEASRHAWNCIVDVVPYDAQATFFMGHPDQPYFFTRGNNLSRAYFNKYKKARNQDYTKEMTELIIRFLGSPFFKSGIAMPWGQGIQHELRELGWALGKESEQIMTLFTTAAPRHGPVLRGLDDTRASIDAMLSQLDFTSFASLKNFSNILKGSPSRIELRVGVSPDPDEGRQILFKKLRASGLPVAQLSQIKDLGFYDSAATVLFSAFFGIELDYLRIRWPNIDRDITEMLSRQEDYTQFGTLINMKLDALPTKSRFSTQLIAKIDKSFLAIWNHNSLYHKSSMHSMGPSPKIVVFSELFAEVLQEVRSDDKQFRSYLQANIDVYILKEKEEKERKKLEGDPAGDNLTIKQRFEQKKSIINNALDALEELKKRISIQQDSGRGGLFTPETSILGKLNIDVSTRVKDLVIDNFLLFKGFIYFFSNFVLQDNKAANAAKDISFAGKQPLPPNMKVFRSHHYVDTKHNIIKNKIVSTTREMWNTVVIEHPDPGSAESVVPNKEEVYKQGRINAGANWVYYPKQEVTGVIGLQFHPGLTLANKKIKVFTELNCQTTDLAAKLACEHLASGIRKMYRGNLLVLGKNMKPHDRIILADSYLKMSGPVEVESLVHHWNTEQGWITNIIPNTVCDANPGAGILHTAALEATYQGVYNTLEFVSDVLTVAVIIATAGAATPLAAGKFAISRGLKTVAGRFLKGGIRGGLKRTFRAQMGKMRHARRLLRGSGKSLFTSGQSIKTIREIIKNFSGPAISILKNNLYIGAAQWGTHMAFKMNVIAGFVESSKDVEQLPVIIAPLIFNGNPFTSGLETEDSIWAIAGFGLFYSAAELQRHASRFLNDLEEE